jgi:TetR/AcrR family transcriptional regulator, cholesterol catabolism regulator
MTLTGSSYALSMRATAMPDERDGVVVAPSNPPDEWYRILDVVAELLGEAGYDALLLRDVAKRARVSMTTIYTHFPSKDVLVVAAVERWMGERVYAKLPSVQPDAPLSERLAGWYRQLFAPWEQNPAMLRVFMQAAMLPGGERLSDQGAAVALPVSEQMFAGYPQDLADDVNMILGNVVLGLLSRFASSRVEVAEIVSDVERTISRLTAGADTERTQR